MNIYASSRILFAFCALWRQLADFVCILWSLPSHPPASPPGPIWHDPSPNPSLGNPFLMKRTSPCSNVLNLSTNSSDTIPKKSSEIYSTRYPK